MAINIPRSDGPTVQSSATPTARMASVASETSFGGGAAAASVFDAASKAAGVAGQIFEEEKKKTNDIAVNDAFVQLRTKKQNAMWDPKEGAFTKRGKNAFGVMDEYGARFDSDADEIERGLANDDQKAMYRKMRGQERADLDTQLQRHIFTEAKQFDDQTTNAAIAVSRNDAVLGFNDPEKVKANIELQRQFLQTYAAREGMEGFAAQAKITGELSKTHTAIVDRFLDTKSFANAEQYFKDNINEFTADDRSKMEASLQERALEDKTFNASDSIMAKRPSLSQALAEAKQITDPTLRKSVTKQVVEEFDLQSKARRDQEEKLSIKAANLIDGGTKWSDIPASDKRVMDAATKTALQNYAKQKAEGVTIPANGADYYGLTIMASDPATRKAFLEVDLRQYSDKIAPAELKEMIGVQTEIRKSGGSDKLDGILSDMEVINSVLGSTGVDVGAKKDTKDGARVWKFHQAVNKRVIALQAATGKKASSEDVQRISEELVVQGVTKTYTFPLSGGEQAYWPAAKKRLYEREEGEEFDITIDAIPAAEKKAISDELTRRKIPVTDERLLKIFNAKIKGDANG